MALSAAKIKVSTKQSSLSEFSLYTSADDIFTPMKPLPVRVGSNTLFASLYPPKTINTGSVYIRIGNTTYRLKTDNTVPLPDIWLNGIVPYGAVNDVAAGNGLFMYVGYGLILSPAEFRCYTSPDGINWTRKTDPFPAASNKYSPKLAFHHGCFYCTNGENLVWSPDGNSWTSFTPDGLRAGYVYDMWVNYWNQKYAYYIGEWNSNNNHIGLVGEKPDISSSVGQDIFNKGYSGYFYAKAFFWGKHFYIIGEGDLSTVQMFLHLDSSNNPSQPAVDSAIANQFPGSTGSDGRYYPIAFLPYGNKLFVRYTNSSSSVVVRSTVDGYTFSPDTLPFSTPAAPGGAVLAQGDDISRRLAIISGGNNTFYVYDHIAGNAPVPVFTAPNGINKVVSTNGIYLAQGPGSATSGGNRLWTASFP
jgi:hypothetical protein